LGPEQARALLARVNQPAESALRVNTLRSTPAEVLAALPVVARPAPMLEEGLVLEAPFDVQSSELWSTGAVMAQSRASMLVSRVLAPRPGERVLDLCAAPGAKTTHLAALMAGDGEVIAVERRAARAQALARSAARMHADRVRVEVADASVPLEGQQFDRVLVDPPCSGLGTLQSRPDIRWRASPESIAELAALQSRILKAAGAATAPGGVLVYSVCTISRAEGAEVIDQFLAENEDFAPEQGDYPPDPTGRYIKLLSHREGTDGFFIARLRRT
jgi:16S rRNA (cytosine967-C5)-methyltransferase